MIKFVSLSEFIRYRAIKVPPFNYLNTLRGAWSDFYGPSGPAVWVIWAELSSEIETTWDELSWADFFMGRVVLGRLVFGPSCPEPPATYRQRVECLPSRPGACGVCRRLQFSSIATCTHSLDVTILHFQSVYTDVFKHFADVTCP